MAAPKLPASVTLGPVEYSITIDADDWMRIEHQIQKKGYYGHTEHLPAVIYLNPGLSDSQRRLTLLHEVMHAAAESLMGAPNYRNLGAEKADRDEAVIRMWEAPMLSIIRDNPELLAYLTA